MPGRGADERDHRRGDGGRPEISYGAYSSARDRFFATLRADAEVRRLEKAWSLPARDHWTGGPQPAP